MIPVCYLQRGKTKWFRGEESDTPMARIHQLVSASSCRRRDNASTIFCAAMLVLCSLAVLLCVWSRAASGQDYNGTPGNDSMTVNSGQIYDSVNGTAGNDTIINNGEVTDIDGDTDNDTITNNNQVNFNIHGGEGDDTITNNGGVFNDIEGEDGNDTIINNSFIGDDIEAGAGNDTVINYGIINDDMEGQDGDDTLTNHGEVWDDIEGGNGTDTIYNTGYVDEDIFGGDGDDTITNTETGNILAIFGGDGNDIIHNQGYLDDAIYGGNGADTITNSGAGDVGGLLGGEGDDTITHTGFGAVGIEGGDGDDTVTARGVRIGYIVGDNGAGNVGLNDVLNIYGGSVLVFAIDEFETVNKLGAGAVTMGDVLYAQDCDFFVDMYDAIPQFIIPDLDDDPADISVTVRGGYWGEGQVVSIFSTGAEADFDVETVDDTSPFLTFTIANAQVTAARSGVSYQGYVPTSSNAYDLAGVLDDLAPSASGELAEVIGILDFMNTGRMEGAIIQLGPTLHGGFNGAVNETRFMFSNALLAKLRQFRTQVGGPTNEAALALTGAPVNREHARQIEAEQVAETMAFAQGLMELVGVDQTVNMRGLSPALNRYGFSGGERLPERFSAGFFDPTRVPGASDPGPSVGFDVSQDLGAWARILGSTALSDDEEGFAGWQSFNEGIVAGIDQKWSESTLAGVYLGWSHSDIYFTDQGGSEATGDILHAGVYGSWFGEDMYVDAALGGFMGWWRADRAISIDAYKNRAHGEFQSMGISATVQAGYDFTWDKVTLGPTVGLEYMYALDSSYTESGAGNLNLSVDSRSSHSLRSLLGGRMALNLSHATETRTYSIIPELRVQWAHEYLDPGDVSSSLTAGGGDFTYELPDGNRDSGRVGLGLTVQDDEGMAVIMGYDAEFGPGRQDHNVSLGLRLTF